MNTAPANPVDAGWTALFDAVTQARALVAAEVVDDQTRADGEAYVARVLAAGLGGAVLGHLFHADGLSRALPVYGGPNPDYIMRFASVSAGQDYRLEGCLNASDRVGVGLYSYDGPNGAPLERGYAAFEPKDCAADGSFALDIGEAGLAIAPETRVMLVRVLHRDPDGPPASLRFTGAPPQRGLALAMAGPGGSPQAALGFVAHALLNNIREYLKWMRAARDLANRLDLAPPELTATVQGDRDTQYYLGGFALADGEWLEVTVSAPPPGYWSLHAYNFWYEHPAVPGIHDRNAAPNPDGTITIAVGPVRPTGAANWIDSVGRQRGAFVCRMIGGGACPTARVRTL